MKQPVFHVLRLAGGGKKKLNSRQRKVIRAETSADDVDRQRTDDAMLASLVKRIQKACSDNGTDIDAAWARAMDARQKSAFANVAYWLNEIAEAERTGQLEYFWTEDGPINIERDSLITVMECGRTHEEIKCRYESHILGPMRAQQDNIDVVDGFLAEIKTGIPQQLLDVDQDLAHAACRAMVPDAGVRENMEDEAARWNRVCQHEARG